MHMSNGIVPKSNGIVPNGVHGFGSLGDFHQSGSFIGGHCFVYKLLITFAS
jgi:hypothetical protein